MSSVPGAFAENLRRYAPATRRLREAAQRYVDAAVPGAVATVAALPCREPGCPPVEVAVQVLVAAAPENRPPGQRLHWDWPILST